MNMNLGSVFLFIIIVMILILGIKSFKCDFNSNSVVILDRKSTDAIRGIAALLIVVHHLCQYAEDKNIVFTIISIFGNLTIATFFLLSGYANRLSYVKIEHKSNREKIIWAIEKIIRVILTYLIVYIMSLPIQMYYYPDIKLADSVFKNIFTLSYYEIDIWYIRIQVLLYALFLICFVAIPKKFSTIFLFAISVGICLTFYGMGLSSYWYDTLLCFPLGVFIAERKETINDFLRKSGRKYLMLLILLFLLFAFEMGIKNYGMLNVLYPLGFCCFVTVFLFRFHLNSKIFSWIGNFSLELYLVHIVLLKYFIIEDFGNTLLIFKYLSIVFGSILLSYLIHTAIISRILGVIKKIDQVAR